jgi:hypothetical protein
VRRGVLCSVICDLGVEPLLEHLANRALLCCDRAEIDTYAVENRFCSLGWPGELRVPYKDVIKRRSMRSRMSSPPKSVPMVSSSTRFAQAGPERMWAVAAVLSRRARRAVTLPNNETAGGFYRNGKEFPW